MTDFYSSYPVSGGGGVPTYVNFAAFPAAATAGNGALAIDLSTNILYESNGSSWLVVSNPAFASAITALTGDVTATGPGGVPATVAAIQGTTVTGTTGTNAVAFSNSPTLVTPALGTPSALVGTNITGTGAGFTSGSTNALKSATTTVNVNSATAPTTGQILTATSGTAATWQAPATSGTVTSVNVSGGTTGLTFSGGPVTSSGTITMAGDLAIANGGTNSTTPLNNNRIMVSATGAIVEAAALTDGQLLIGSTSAAPVAASITGTANQVTVTPGAGTITLALPQNINTGATPTFASETLTANTNQLTLGTTNTTTMTMAGLSGSRTFTLPDANSNPVRPLGSGTTHQWVSYIDSTGVQNTTQPAFTDISGTAQITQGGTGQTTAVSVPAASTYAAWDGNKNMSANAFIPGYATTATAAGTTTLTTSSAQQQYFTGATTQTVQMPVVATLVTGQHYTIVNNSSGVVTVQSSGANTIVAMAASSTAILTCISTSGTSAASWNFEYSLQSTAGTVTSVAMSVPSLLSVSGSPVTTSGTLAVTYSGTALPLANGGTGQTTKTPAFDALSPMTTAGDIIYGGASGTGTRLAAGTSSQVLIGGTTPAWSTSIPASSAGTTPGAGFIGQQLVASLSNGSSVSSPISGFNGGTLSLPAGNWLVFGKWYLETVTGTMTVTNLSASLSSTSGTTNSATNMRITTTYASGDQEIVAGPYYVSQNSTANVYLVVGANWTGGGTSRFNGANSSLYAIRQA